MPASKDESENQHSTQMTQPQEQVPTQEPTPSLPSKESKVIPSEGKISTTEDLSHSTTEETGPSSRKEAETPAEQESNDETLTPGGLTEGEVKKIMEQWDEHLAMSPEEVAEEVKKRKAAGHPLFVSDDEYDDDESEESDLEMLFP